MEQAGGEWRKGRRLITNEYVASLRVVERSSPGPPPRSQPRFIVLLPGTEGMAGYRDYRFHFRRFLHGIPAVALGSAFTLGVILILSQVWS